MNGTMREILSGQKDLLEIGESVRLNHVDCDAGVDTRRRLYITRKPDVLLAYCHNCGESASHYMAASDRYRETPQSAIRKPAIEYTSPLLISFTEKEAIPAEAEAWRINNRLTRTNCKQYNISYAPEWDSIYLPFYGMDGDIDGHQFRPLHRRGGAKYINFQKDKDVALGGIATQNISMSCLVVVEDLVSSIHINKAGYDALINYGTHVKPTILHNISNDYKKICVWLDNDNEVVIEHAKQMTAILQLYNRSGAVIELISEWKDPKHYSDTKIREVIDGHS